MLTTEAFHAWYHRLHATLSGGNPPGFKSNHTNSQIKLVYKSSRYPAKKSVNC
jgi:hypothetical protein